MMAAAMHIEIKISEKVSKTQTFFSKCRKRIEIPAANMVNYYNYKRNQSVIGNKCRVPGFWLHFDDTYYNERCKKRMDVFHE